jgi:hypothetical protein
LSLLLESQSTIALWGSVNLRCFPFFGLFTRKPALVCSKLLLIVTVEFRKSMSGHSIAQSSPRRQAVARSTWMNGYGQSSRQALRSASISPGVSERASRFSIFGSSTLSIGFTGMRSSLNALFNATLTTPAIWRTVLALRCALRLAGALRRA